MRPARPNRMDSIQSEWTGERCASYVPALG